MEKNILDNIAFKNSSSKTEEELFQAIRKKISLYSQKADNLLEELKKNIKKIKIFSVREIEELEYIFELFEFDRKTDDKNIYIQLKQWMNLYFELHFKELAEKDYEMREELISFKNKLQEQKTSKKSSRFSLDEWKKEKLNEKEYSLFLKKIHSKLKRLTRNQLILVYFCLKYSHENIKEYLCSPACL